MTITETLQQTDDIRNLSSILGVEKPVEKVNFQPGVYTVKLRVLKLSEYPERFKEAGKDYPLMVSFTFQVADKTLSTRTFTPYFTSEKAALHKFCNGAWKSLKEFEEDAVKGNIFFQALLELRDDKYIEISKLLGKTTIPENWKDCELTERDFKVYGQPALKYFEVQ